MFTVSIRREHCRILLPILIHQGMKTMEQDQTWSLRLTDNQIVHIHDVELRASIRLSEKKIQIPLFPKKNLYDYPRKVWWALWASQIRDFKTIRLRQECSGKQECRKRKFFPRDEMYFMTLVVLGGTRYGGAVINSIVFLYGLSLRTISNYFKNARFVIYCPFHDYSPDLISLNSYKPSRVNFHWELWHN